MINFKNKTAIITGAAGGIGRATAKLMYNNGANLILCDLSKETLKNVQESLSSSTGGGTIDCYELDIAKASACEKVLEKATNQHKTINYLINSAGVYPEHLVKDMTDEQWRRLMSINLDGLFYMSRASIPFLSSDSAIVNLSSMAAHRGSYGHAHYSASKGAVSSLSKSLAKELAPKTRVNIVAPGIIATPMIEQLAKKSGGTLLAETPLRRFGEPEEVAKAIVFLCSDLASFITGETLHVNGGLYIV